MKVVLKIFNLIFEVGAVFAVSVQKYQRLAAAFFLIIQFYVHFFFLFTLQRQLNFPNRMPDYRFQFVRGGFSRVGKIDFVVKAVFAKVVFVSVLH